MKMKLKSIIAVLIILVPVLAFSQGKHKIAPEERAEMQTKRMYVELDLSKEQMAKVETINLKNAKEMEKVQVERKEIKEKQKEKMNTIREQHEEALKDVLTEDQYKTFLKLQMDKKREKSDHQGKRERK